MVDDTTAGTENVDSVIGSIGQVDNANPPVDAPTDLTPATDEILPEDEPTDPDEVVNAKFPIENHPDKTQAQGDWPSTESIIGSQFSE